MVWGLGFSNYTVCPGLDLGSLWERPDCVQALPGSVSGGNLQTTPTPRTILTFGSRQFGGVWFGFDPIPAAPSLPMLI